MAGHEGGSRTAAIGWSACGIRRLRLKPQTAPRRRRVKVERVTRSRANYDRLSRWYDLLAEPWEGPYRRAGLQALGAREGEAVLEIGFGTGRSLLPLAQAVGSGGRACGVDLSRGMCRVARARLVRAGLAGRVPLVCGDTLRLPFAAGTFDAILMSFTLELFEAQDMPVVLQECGRVLRRGGRLAVVALAKTARAGAMVQLYEWLHVRLPRHVDCRPIAVESVLGAAGFRIATRAERRTYGLSVAIVAAEFANP